MRNQSQAEYVKRFESIVQQEIKNYNDTVLTTNMALENCRKKIEDLKCQTAKSFMDHEAQFLVRDAKLEKSVEEFRQNIYTLNSRIDSLSTHIDGHRKAAEALISDIQVGKIDRKEFQSVVQGIQSGIKELSDVVNALSGSMNLELQRLSNAAKMDVENLRREILDRPSEAEEVRKDLEKLLGIAKVDADGIMREIAVYKKTSFITEKHIENLYTQIERLKERIK